MPMRIVCLGDSITAGVGREESWVALLQHSSSHTWINAGIVGDTAVGMLCRLQDCIRQHKPDMVLWLGGVNDILLTGSRDLPVSCTMAAVHQCVAAGVLPVVGIPYSIADVPDIPICNRGAAAALTGYQQWLRSLCSTYHLRCVDFALPFESHREYLQPDGLHPNAQGNRVMAQSVQNGAFFREDCHVLD